MALTQRQREVVVESLKKKVKSGCPMCGEKTWTVGDELVGCMAASLQGGIGLGGPYIPMVQSVCNNCGFVAHHAVGILGIKLE